LYDSSFLFAHYRKKNRKTDFAELLLVITRIALVETLFSFTTAKKLNKVNFMKTTPDPEFTMTITVLTLQYTDNSVPLGGDLTCNNQDLGSAPHTPAATCWCLRSNWITSPFIHQMAAHSKHIPQWLVCKSLVINRLSTYDSLYPPGNQCSLLFYTYLISLPISLSVVNCIISQN